MSIGELSPGKTCHKAVKSGYLLQIHNAPWQSQVLISGRDACSVSHVYIPLDLLPKRLLLIKCTI